MKERLDVLLVQKGYFPTREKAKGTIMAGLVFVNGRLFDKPGMSIPVDAEIFVKGNDCPYVGRGGFKLQKALDTFALSVQDAVCADIGASTGGFTDCMLQRGAQKVYAIDVGHGQLDYKLQIDSRVVNLEKTNIRLFDPNTITPCNFISIDVSFISLKLVFPVAVRMLEKSSESHLVCLVKPQFEAGKEQVGKHGVVADPSVHREVIQNVIEYAKDNGMSPVGLTYSPITGGKEGNIEYLLHMVLSSEHLHGNENDGIVSDFTIDSIVSEAHNTLK